MRKVFKPENIMKNDKPVIIPDMEFKPLFEEKEEEIEKEKEEKEKQEEEKVILTDEVYDNIKEELRNELAGELGKQKLRAAHERDMILSAAKKEAKKIIDEANENKRQMLEEAEASVNEIQSKAYNDGLKQALESKTAALDELSKKIADTINILRNEQETYFVEYSTQLKYLAIEIAEKIINQKILEDDMTMYNLIKNAIKTARNASWIKAEISQSLSGYADSLEKELAECGMNVEIMLNDEMKSSDCVLNTSDGMIVASVAQQLEKMKEFIERQSKGGNDEEVS